MVPLCQRSRQIDHTIALVLVIQPVAQLRTIEIEFLRQMRLLHIAPLQLRAYMDRRRAPVPRGHTGTTRSNVRREQQINNKAVCDR